MNRSAGVLMHVSSLPSNYGIGTFGKEAYAFVDFLKEAGQTYWQMLPLHPTGFGNSPYQALSSFVGNPYLIDLDMLIEDGLLKKEEVEDIDWGKDVSKVDYGKLYENRFAVLEKASRRLASQKSEDYFAFLEEEKEWLKDYATFMAIKEDRHGQPWSQWPQELRNHTSEEVKEEAYRLRERVFFYERIQYLFSKQIKALKKYANENGIKIIGDLPFYIASDSSDVWVSSEQFLLDEATHTIQYVSGMPVDGANPNGQKWGNPLFDWNRMEQEQYQWWIKRAKHALQWCDVLRIDHFQGYLSYYAIEIDGEAKDGHWCEGPGLKPFHYLEEEVKDVEMIVEDLGYLSDEFKQMIKDSGYPGMRILEYAFDPNDTYSLYMPFQHEKNSVVYIGTHDNETLKQWIKDKNQSERVKRACAYLGCDKAGLQDAMLRCLYGSRSDIAIVQMQDLLGSDTRMNDPVNYQEAWCYRCEKGSYNRALAKKIKQMMLVYARNNWNASQ